MHESGLMWRWRLLASARRKLLYSLLQPQKHFRNGHAECTGEHRQHLNRKIACAIFCRSNVRSVNAANIRELLLRPLALLS